MSKNLEKEIWKKIVFPNGFKTKANYQISNYGRVRNILEDGSLHIKKPIFQNGQSGGRKIGAYNLQWQVKGWGGIKIGPSIQNRL